MSRLMMMTAALSLFAPAWALSREGQAAMDEGTKAQVRETIQQYVERDVQLKDAFLVLDPRTGEALRLAFDHVHAGVKPHEKGHLACVDFKGQTGKVYDVDIVAGKSQDGWRVTKVFLHKVEGKALDAK